MMPMSKEEAVKHLSNFVRDVDICRAIINSIWPIPDTPEPAPEYGDWIIWNAKPDSVCPVPEGTMGQVQMVMDTREDAIERGDCNLSKWDWYSIPYKSDIAAYRIRQTPARGEPIVLYGTKTANETWIFSTMLASYVTWSHRITLESDASSAPKDGGIQQVEVLK